MASELTVVANLNRAQVSWADGFCSAVESAGATVADLTEVDSAQGSILFIGDVINWKSIDDEGRVGYFLAAADGTTLEAENIRRANLTTTVSSAEQVRAEQLFSSSSISVDGFPIDFTELAKMRCRRAQRSTPTIGFIGRTDADKGPELEVQIAIAAKKRGARVLHISNMANALGPRLKQERVEVYDNVSRAEYLGRLAGLGCVINTSPRESLYVSGLEASYLGVPVVAPWVEGSGIRDWNLPERFYNRNQPEEAVELAMSLSTQQYVNTPDVSSYAAPSYVQRVLARLEEMP